MTSRQNGSDVLFKTFTFLRDANLQKSLKISSKLVKNLLSYEAKKESEEKKKNNNNNN